MSKNIWIFNHHASKSGHRHFDFANQFARLGHTVLVFASSYSHHELKYTQDEECAIEDVSDSVKYVWLRTKPAYSSNGTARLLNMFSYVRLIYKYAPKIWTKYGKPDTVIGSSVHPLVWESAYWLKKKVHAKFIMEIRDLWPLSLIELSGMTRKHPLVVFFGWIEKRAFKHSNEIVCTMPYAGKYIREKGVCETKVHWIPNGIDISSIEDALSSGVTLPEALMSYLKNHWCCVYTGSFVESECCLFLCDVAKTVAERGYSEIFFAFIGDGHDRNKLAKYIMDNNISNACIFPRITKPQVALTLRTGKVCIAATRSLPIYRFGLSINKLNDYLYSGTPTVFACDARNIVEESGGISIPYGDVALYANEIIKLYHMKDYERIAIGRKGIEAIKEKYDYKTLVGKYAAIL